LPQSTINCGTSTALRQQQIAAVANGHLRDFRKSLQQTGQHNLQQDVIVDDIDVARSRCPSARMRKNTREYQRAILERAIVHEVSRIESPFFEVIRRCLAPDPAQRYADFSALRGAIKSAVKAAGIPAIDFMVAPGFKGSFDDYINRGRSYLVLGRHERALAILDKAVKHDPNSFAAVVGRAEALAHRGHYVEAVRAYELAQGLKPEDTAPTIGMASSWLALDLPQKARAALDRVLADQPENVEALLLLARVYGAEGDDQTALKIVEKVVALDPRDWRAQEYRGRALWGLGRLAEAAQALRTCLCINPLALHARLTLTSLLTAQKATAAAAEEYKRAVELFRDNPEALHRIAAHMSDGGHEKGAIELFRGLGEAVPESRSIMMVCVGNAQLRSGDAVSAADSYRQALEADPDNALAHSRLGDIEADAGPNGKAAEYYARACEFEPENWRYQGFAGTAYLQDADYNRAAAHLRRSIELSPNSRACSTISAWLSA
jgi:tetratricopeptide (TPR) repeat protein